MSSYTIHAKRQTHHLTEQSGIVTSCSIEFLEGLAFDVARSLLEQKGWTIVPMIEEPTNIFSFRGSEYELRWRDNRVVNISKDGEEISWDELPDELKGLL